LVCSSSLSKGFTTQFVGLNSLLPSIGWLGQKRFMAPPRLLMKKTDGAFKKIGNLYVRCKPGRELEGTIEEPDPSTCLEYI